MRFYYGGQKWDWWYGQYTIYTATYTHADGFEMPCTAVYWHNYGVVTFTYVHTPDKGKGTWVLSSNDGVSSLTGKWESTLGNGGGTWNLSR